MPNDLLRAYGRITKRLKNIDGCQIWQGSKNSAGYGTVWTGESRDRPRWSLVHRVVWEAINGPIPGTLVVCHACDTPACCNIDHLFLGSQAANLADMRAKGRGASGEDLAAAIRTGWTPELRQMRREQTRQRMADLHEAAAIAAGVPVEWKRCPTCETWKARSEYHRNAARADGIKPICKPCATRQTAELRRRRTS